MNASPSWRRLERQLCAAIRSDGVRIPEAGRLFLQWFAQLNQTRTYHAAGPNPVSYAEIQAWAYLHRIPLEPRHVELLRAMDRARLAPADAKEGRQPATKLTATAFDAVFG